jgi:hypothetical protein
MGEITHGQVRANLEARLASGEFQIVDRSRSIRAVSSPSRKPSRRNMKGLNVLRPREYMVLLGRASGRFLHLIRLCSRPKDHCS